MAQVRRSAGGVILNSKGQVAVVNQRGVTWSLPKGGVNTWEDDLTAAKREIYEETGITDLTLIGDLGSYERYSFKKNTQEFDTSILKVIRMFLFTTKENTLKPIDPDNPEALWVDKNKVELILSHEKDKEFFRRIMEKI